MTKLRNITHDTTNTITTLPKSAVTQIKYLADSYSKRGDTYTVCKEFFYSNGRDASDFLVDVVSILAKHNLKPIVIDMGEKWKLFKGSASVANSTHWFIIFKVRKVVD